MTSWTKELDEASVRATKSGYWHVVLFYLLCGLAAIPTSFLVFSQVFTNATPEHWCAPSPELEMLSLPESMIRNLTIPKNQEQYDSCTGYIVDYRSLYQMIHDNVDQRSDSSHQDEDARKLQKHGMLLSSTEEGKKQQLLLVEEAILKVRSENSVPCTNGWKFSQEHYERTLVTDYSLVCDKDWLPQTSNTLFWVGSIFGNLLFGWMSDRYGRRPTILLIIVLEVPLAIAASFAGSYWSYVGLRIAGGLFFPALYQLPFVLALELMPPKRRTYTGIVVGMLFASGMCLLSLLAYVIRDWFYLSLATSLPFVVLFGYYWLIPESPRWLVSRGRIAEAEKVFRYIANQNGIVLPRGFLLEIHKKVKEEEEELEATILSNVNGFISRRPDLSKDEFTDRRISNMLTFKPDLLKISDPNNSAKIDRLEKSLDVELADSGNKKSDLQNPRKDRFKENDISDEESHLHLDFQQKSTQTEPYAHSTGSTLKRKSLQFVNRLLIDGDYDDIENKRMDEQNSEGDCKASPLDIFRYPNIRKKFLILTFDWVALGVVYNSLSYNTPNLGVDDYIAFFIGGAVELPSYFLAWRCMERFGRRWVLCVFMSIGGLACLSCLLVPDAWPWVTVSLAMLGRLCAAASFAVFYVLIGEILPTVLRSQAMGAASFISGLGLLVCPYIVHLAKYSRALPLTIMGVLSVVGGITSLFLPETLNQPLPQTLGDGEMFGRNFKIFSCVDRHHEECEDV